MSLLLYPANAALAEAVVTEGWLDDEPTNQAMGYGAGLDGRERAYEAFRDAMKGSALLGAFHAVSGAPMGFVVLARVPEQGLAQFHGFIAPRHRGTIWPARLIQAIEQATLGNGSYRLETEVLCRNERAIRLLKGLGFRPEGAHKARHLMDGKRESTMTLRRLKTEWRAA